MIQSLLLNVACVANVCDMQDIYKKRKGCQRRRTLRCWLKLLLYKLLAWAFHGEMVLPLSNVPPFLFSRTVGTLPRP